MTTGVPITFCGETDEECREAMESISAYLVAETDRVQKSSPAAWRDIMDSKWDTLIFAWACMHDHVARLCDNGVWEIKCGKTVRGPFH